MDRTERPVSLPADDLRASDAERDAVVAQLREHGGAGRLSIEELDERIAAALAAPTRRDLAALVADLPRLPRPRDAARERRELRDHVRSYVAVMALLLVIWALTGAAYFWPIWPILGWGIGVVSHAAAVRPPRRATPA
jgi:hypothetical protein